LIIERNIIVIVPLFVTLALNTVSLLAPVFNPVACISVVDYIAQVPVVPISSSIVLLQGSETTSRVPMWALAMVRVLTPHSISTHENWVHDDGCDSHCLESLNLRIALLIVLR
jgi:hypothetical protein